MKNDLTPNQITIVIVEKSLVEEKIKVTTIPEIPEEQPTLEKGYYHGIYITIHFNKEDVVGRKEEKADV